MATDQKFVDLVVSKIENAGEIEARHMFGEYGLFSKKKFFALICDNKLFIKPTAAGHEYIKEPQEAPPYPGAKNYFLIEDKLKDSSYLSELIRITLIELPEPKRKKKK